MIGISFGLLDNIITYISIAFAYIVWRYRKLCTINIKFTTESNLVVMNEINQPSNVCSVFDPFLNQGMYCLYNRRSVSHITVVLIILYRSKFHY